MDRGEARAVSGVLNGWACPHCKFQGNGRGKFCLRCNKPLKPTFPAPRR
jgi:hypothetical protein